MYELNLGEKKIPKGRTEVHILIMSSHILSLDALLQIKGLDQDGYNPCSRLKVHRATENNKHKFC